MQKQIAAGFAAAVIVAAGMLASRPAAAAIQVMPSSMVADSSFVQSAVIAARAPGFTAMAASPILAPIADPVAASDTGQLAYWRHRHYWHHHHHHGGLLGIHIRL